MISILCPTRGRPDYVRQLIDTAVDTAADPEALEFVFYVDDDDPTGDQVRALAEPGGPGPDVIVIRDRPLNHTEGLTLSHGWNRCAHQAGYDILMHCGDDIRFRTGSWDLTVVDAFAEVPDHIVFVHGRDGHQPDTFGTHGFIHKMWVETVGYFVPPYFRCDWNDTWLNDVANMIGRRRLVPILTEHLHPAWGTRPLDPTDHARMAAGQADNVDQIYRDKLPERERDAAKLRQIIQRYSLTDGALAPTETSTS
jgi:hypothetical protein